ncbi:MAG: hypothetical protein NTZ38_03385 [Candidatus Taylorbacteria bacterium]|nr:hypothetical protein [Candidatus Taylorbacteria bacterium]
MKIFFNDISTKVCPKAAELTLPRTSVSGAERLVAREGNVSARLPLVRSLSLVTLFLMILIAPLSVHASLDPFSKDFKLSVCDGPTLPANYVGKPNNYVPCDFNGAMKQAQALIDAMIIIGVLFSIASFSYAGLLYISGQPGRITQANVIFQKVGIGFIIMISAWFIVYQLIDWLVGNPGVKALLGNP